MLFNCDFITYKGIVTTVETDKVNVPTSEGRRTILSNHMPIMLPLEMGVIETSKDGKLSHFVINSGVLYFRDNQAEIVCNNMLRVEDIDVQRAENNKQKAIESYNKAKDDITRSREEYKIALADTLINAYHTYQE